MQILIYLSSFAYLAADLLSICDHSRALTVVHVFTTSVASAPQQDGTHSNAPPAPPPQAVTPPTVTGPEAADPTPLLTGQFKTLKAV